MNDVEMNHDCNQAPDPREIYGKDIKNHRSAICDILGIENDQLDALSIVSPHVHVRTYWEVVFPTMPPKKHRIGDDEVYIDGCEHVSAAARRGFNGIGHILSCFKGMPKLTEACPELANIIKEAVTNIVVINACRFNVHFQPIFTEDLTDDCLDENPMVRKYIMSDEFCPLAYIFPSRETAIANRNKIRTMSDVTYGAAVEAFCRPFIQLRDKVSEIDLDEDHPAHYEAQEIYKKLMVCVAKLRYSMLNAEHINVFNRPIDPDDEIYKSNYPSPNINAWYADEVAKKLNDCLLIADRLDKFRANQVLQNNLIGVYYHAKSVINTMLEMLTEDERDDYEEDELFDDNDRDVRRVFAMSNYADSGARPKHNLKKWSRHDLNTVMLMSFLFNTEPYSEFNDALMDNLRRVSPETESEEG